VSVSSGVAVLLGLPLSHPFVERLIGTVRSECLDRTVFWTAADLEMKLLDFQGYQQCFAAHGGQPIERQSAPTDIDEYTAGFPPHVQKRPKKLRATIMKAALEAQETIKYRMPTFTLHGNVIHFAAYKHHIGLHPAPNGTQKFKKELCLRMRARRAPQGFRWTSPFLSTWSAGFVKSRV
jgi:uncharacterized protein YdhG (YjbR/CyaY superfamily)